MTSDDYNKNLHKVLKLAYFTLAFNLLIGSIAVYLGLKEKALTLLGFGLDNLAELFSSIGLIHFLQRKKQGDSDLRDDFEKTALKITGTAFFILAGGLAFFTIWRIMHPIKPPPSTGGIIISLVSIVVIYNLIHRKKKLAGRLGSRAVYYDAKCQKACLWFADVLLADTILYYLTGFVFLEFIGTALILLLSFREGIRCIKAAARPACQPGSYCDG